MAAAEGLDWFPKVQFWASLGCEVSARGRLEFSSRSGGYGALQASSISFDC